MTEDIIITMTRMNCNSCVRNIINAISILAGIEVISVDLPSKTIYLRLSPSLTSYELLQKTLAQANYPIAQYITLPHTTMKENSHE